MLLNVRRALAALAALCALSLFSIAVRAGDAAPPKLNPEHGPKTIDLGAQGTLKLPAGYVYLNQQDASAMLTYWGNPGPHQVMGMVLAEDDKSTWALSLRFRPEGYVKDEDAKTWDADELFKSVKEGTEASNEERQKIGGGRLHIVDWVQKPSYEASTHRLAWGIRAEAVDDAGHKEDTVNYHTYVLGREGFIEMNLMTDPKGLAVAKPRADELLAATSFKDGKRYEEFSASTDKVATFGLAALVAGGVAKKLGLRATIVMFFGKFWKVVLVGLALFGGGVAKLFKRKSA
jgi:uncharacterized membrane-anchored protein